MSEIKIKVTSVSKTHVPVTTKLKHLIAKWLNIPVQKAFFVETTFEPQQNTNTPLKTRDIILDNNGVKYCIASESKSEAHTMFTAKSIKHITEYQKPTCVLRIAQAVPEAGTTKKNN